MDLLIKGKEMPKTAFECSTKINPEERRCNFTGKVFEETLSLLTQRRCADCPLVAVPAPHGQLIDREELLKLIKEYDYHFGTEIEHGRCVSFSRTVLEMPIIIEAEGKTNKIH